MIHLITEAKLPHRDEKKKSNLFFPQPSPEPPFIKLSKYLMALEKNHIF